MSDKKEYMKKYNQEHKKEFKEYKKQYRIDNYEHRKEYMKKWRINNTEHIKQYGKQYYKTPDGRAAQQRAQCNRRRILANTLNTLTSKEWEDILEQYNYRCAYCGVEFNCELLPTKDHVIPISKGGDNTKENIVPACKSCNSKKNNKLTFHK